MKRLLLVLLTIWLPTFLQCQTPDNKTLNAMIQLFNQGN